ncbi:MAG: hypothetical protein E6Q97_36975 [Desulfurellales bacterium]|nr:MAG: hypothetical protein E6Q97_36975 [Desulfurellales bacterium]
MNMVEAENSPLTRVAAGEFAPEVVKSFLVKIKEKGGSSLRNAASAFCQGKATARWCIWTEEFRAMACSHFLFKNFEDAFTEQGKRGQMIANSIHRRIAARSNLDRKAWKGLTSIAAKAKIMLTIAEKYGAKLEFLPDGAMRAQIRDEVVTVDANGIQATLADESQDVKNLQ